MKKYIKLYPILYSSLFCFLFGTLFCYFSFTVDFDYVIEHIGTIILTIVGFGTGIFLLVMFIMSLIGFKAWEKENKANNRNVENKTNE